MRWKTRRTTNPRQRAQFESMLDALPVAANGFTFVDLGAGMGRVVLLASTPVSPSGRRRSFAGALRNRARQFGALAPDARRSFV